MPAKAPRPVTTMALVEGRPISKRQVTGSVHSWKNEEIGFEIPGRLEWVLEPGRNVEGQVTDVNGNVLIPGTALAKVESSQFQVAVESALAGLEVAQRNLEVAEIRLRESIPEDIKSAQSDVDLALSEYQRAKQLRPQRAISQTEFESAVNELQTTQSRLASLQSSLVQAELEVRAGQARVKSAEQDLKNARRDLANTTLYASYAGQVADVDVVPGSIVAAGSPIMNLQMMNPIKVEVEVSADQSRELQKRRQVLISYPMPDGSIRKERSILYYMDPSADPSTRTFTATFLIINRQVRSPLPHSLQQIPLARTEDVWPLNISQIISGQPGAFMIEESTIGTDGPDSYVWMVSNVRFGEEMPPVLKVEKKLVQLSPIRIPFLGNWIFRQATFVDESVSDQNLIVGPLTFFDISENEWDGESVILDSGELWVLRPGDVVSVELSPETREAGFYVPIEAIYEDRGKTYLFVVEQGVVNRSEIRVFFPDKLSTGPLLQVEPLNPNVLKDGSEIVVRGVHYLNDGESVRVIESDTQNVRLP